MEKINKMFIKDITTKIDSKKLLEKIILEFEYCHERIYNMYIKTGNLNSITKTFNSYKMEI